MNTIEYRSCIECKYSDYIGVECICNKHSGMKKDVLGEDVNYIEYHSPYWFCADYKDCED